MFLLTHGAMGAVVGQLMPEHPVFVFLLSFVIHFLADVIPHGDTELYNAYTSGVKSKIMFIYVALDILGTILFIAWIIYGYSGEQLLGIGAGVLGGISPDILVGTYQWLRWSFLEGFHKAHFFFHSFITKRMGDLPLLGGVLLELVIIGSICFNLQ